MNEPQSVQPEDQDESDYRPVVRTIIGASVGVMVGSVGQWMTVGMFAMYGLDSGKWGITALTLGAVSCIAMTIEFFWPRDVRWGVPITWAVAVAGVACVSYAVPFGISIMTLTFKANFIGIPMGPEIGWGLWLLALSAGVMCVAAYIVATRMAGDRFAPARRAATVTSAVIAMSSVGYFSALWANDNNEPSGPITNFPTFPTKWPMPETTTPTATSTTSTTTQPEVTNIPSPTLPPGVARDEFLAAVRGAGVRADEAALLNAGHEVCAGFSQGRTSEDMEDDVARLIDDSLASARALINDAKVFLCPQ